MKKQKKSVGRPALPKALRQKPLQIRISDEQRSLAEKAAKKQKKKLAAFARDAIVDTANRVIDG